MTEYIRKFLEENKDDLLSEDVAELYRKISNSEHVADLTKTFLNANIQPLENLRYAPCRFAENLDGIEQVSDQKTEEAWKNVFIGNKVELIHADAFYGCPDLKFVKIPSNVRYIGTDAFYRCFDLSTLDLSEAKSLVEIDNNAFSFTSIDTIHFPESLKTIGSYCFQYCQNLSKIDFSNVETLDKGAFLRCSSLTEVVIPSCVTRIGANTFAECSRLDSVEIYAKIKRLPKQMFRGCERLTSVLIGSGIQTIDDDCFSGCYSLERIMLPKTLKSIDSKIFEECYSLEEIFFAGTLNEFSDICMNGFESVSEFLQNIKDILPKFKKITCMDGDLK